MKPIVVLISCLFVFTTFATAQSCRWTFTAQVGPSIPLGKFGEKNPNDSLAAFAKTGPALQLTASYRVGRYWGISVMTAGEEHAVDTKAVETKLHEDFGLNYHYTSDPWILARLMAGVFGEWPAGKHWLLTAHLYLGGIETKLPKTSLTAQGSSGAYGYTKNAGSIDVGPAGQGGVGTRYLLGRHLFLDAGAEYATGRYRSDYPAIKLASQGEGLVFTTGTTPPYIASGSSHYTQPISTLNLTVGAGIRL
jgi:hypothetical protein